MKSVLAATLILLVTSAHAAELPMPRSPGAEAIEGVGNAPPTRIIRPAPAAKSSEPSASNEPVKSTEPSPGDVAHENMKKMTSGPTRKMEGTQPQVQDPCDEGASPQMVVTQGMSVADVLCEADVAMQAVAGMASSNVRANVQTRKKQAEITRLGTIAADLNKQVTEAKAELSKSAGHASELEKQVEADRAAAEEMKKQADASAAKITGLLNDLVKSQNREVTLGEQIKLMRQNEAEAAAKCAATAPTPSPNEAAPKN